MNENEEKEIESKIIEVVDEDGQKVKLELVDVFDMDGVEYALLNPLASDGKPENADADKDTELVVMRLKTEGDEYYIETIEDDAEFEAVEEYLKNIEE